MASIDVSESPLIGKCLANRDEAVKTYMKCKYDPAFFIDEFVWTVDPQLGATLESMAEVLGVDIDLSDIPSIIRFRLFDFQRDTIAQLVNIRQNSISFNNSLVEKSRQMGLSWLLTALELWAISFWDGTQILNVSRKEDEVDDGGDNSTPKSLHGKIRFMWERLPSFLRPNLVFKFLTIRHDDRNSFIKGESANPNAGRGGTWHFVLLDEAAHIPKSESVFESVKQACKRGLCLNSTPNGKGNVFARIRFQKKSTFRLVTLHWRLHPQRAELWYYIQSLDMTEEQIAQELDISYERSTKGRVYKEFDYPTFVVGDIEYDPRFKTYVTWDFGMHDATSLLFLQEDIFGNVYLFDEIEDNDKIIAYYGTQVQKRGYTIHEHYGDPAGRQRNMVTGRSLIKELAIKFGIKIKTKANVSIIDKIAATKKFLLSGRNGRKPPTLYVSSKCTHFLDCIANYRYPDEREDGVVSEIPVHDWTSHCMNAFEYFVVNRFPQFLLRGGKTRGQYRDNRLAARR